MAAKEVKRRRGTKSQNDAFTGADAEIVVDSTSKRLRVHDAVTAGGIEFLNSRDIQARAGIMAAVSGTADDIILTNTPPAITLTNLFVSFKATADNTGPVTVDPDGLGPVDVYKVSGGTLVPLTGGEIKNGVVYDLNRNGSVFQLGGGTAGGIGDVFIQVFTSSGTYTPTPGMQRCIVKLVGGGGGGAGSDGSSGSRGNGGGQGGIAYKRLNAATVGASQTITIGAGGGGGGSSGSSGGTTSFGAIFSATGGGGGQRGSTSSAAGVGGGGNGSGGDLNITGQAGSAGSSGTTDSVGGSGGGEGGGGGGSGGGGAAGTLGGGGGGGASAGANSGGSGGSGYVYIVEYCSA